MWREINDDERKILLKKLSPWASVLKVMFVILFLFAVPVCLMAWKFLLIIVPIIFICIKIKKNLIITIPVGLLIAIIIAIMIDAAEPAKLLGVFVSFFGFIWLSTKTIMGKIEKIENGNVKICQTKISEIKRYGSKTRHITVKLYENEEYKDVDLKTSNPYEIGDEVYVVSYADSIESKDIYKVKDFS